MAKNKFDSRALRQLAEGLLQEMSQETAIPESDLADLATALVRQWTTYEGSAALFIDNRLFYVLVDMARPMECSVVPKHDNGAWIRSACADWKIGQDQLPGLMGQLNRGQSAEVINADGVPVRLWVNPRERCMGVEPLVKEPVPPTWKRDFRKIASDVLEQRLGLSQEAAQPLIASVEKQWQQYEGHACLFMGGCQLVVTLTECGDGNCNVSAQQVPVNLAPLLQTLGIAPCEIPAVIAQINRGSEFEFRNRDGVPSVLWHDPKVRQIVVRRLGPAPPALPVVSQPSFCSRCGAFLMAQQYLMAQQPLIAQQRPQTCPCCGHRVSQS